MHLCKTHYCSDYGGRTISHINKPWFNHICFCAVTGTEVIQKRYRSHQTPDDHALCISALNGAK